MREVACFSRLGGSLALPITVFQQAVSPHQILTASARLRGEPWDAATIDLALMRAEIERERWDQPIRTLSGGQNKRVRTASELMGRPRLLLLDEPDSGLDGERRASLMRLLRALSWQGCTVVLVTHVVGDLDRFCDRVVEIRRGHVVPDNRVIDATEATVNIADTVAPLSAPLGTKVTCSRPSLALCWVKTGRRQRSKNCGSHRITASWPGLRVRRVSRFFLGPKPTGYPSIVRESAGSRSFVSPASSLGKEVGEGNSGNGVETG